jgi:hypothetical protein
MLSSPAVIVHGSDDAREALAVATRLARPVLLLSAPGAAGFAGCGWWLALIAAARAAYPAADMADILDCGAAPGHAMAALRLGQRALVLDPACPAFARVSAAAAACGGVVLAARPAALDLATHGADRRLAAWLGES